MSSGKPPKKPRPQKQIQKRLAITPEQRREAVLLKIESEYLADPERHSLEWWYQFVRKTIDLDDLRRYAAEQRWDQRRTAYWRGVQAAWLRGQSQLLLTERTRELAAAQQLRAGLFEAIVPQRTPDGIALPFQVTSYEGVIRAFVAVDAMIEQKRDRVAAAVIPMLEEAETATEGGAGTLKISANLPLDGNEVRDIAHLLLAKQRDKVAQVEDEEDEDDDGNKDEDQETEVARGGRGRGVPSAGDRPRLEGKKRPG